MKKVIFNKRPDDKVVYAENIQHLWDMNYSIGLISNNIRYIVIEDYNTGKYKKVSFVDFVAVDLEDNDEYFAFESDNELLDWLKDSQ